MLISNAYAQADAAAVAANSGASSWIMIIVMVLIMWLFIIRPQAKRHSEHQALIGGIKKGDAVVTDSGIYGKVTKIVDENTLEVEIAKDVSVKMLKNAVSAVVDKKAAKVTATKETKKKTTKKKAS